MPISVVVPQRCLTEYKTTPGGVIRRVTFFRCKYQHDFFLEMLGRGGGEKLRELIPLIRAATNASICFISTVTNKNIRKLNRGVRVAQFS